MKLLKFFAKHDPLSLLGVLLVIVGLPGFIIVSQFFSNETGLAVTFAGLGLFGFGFLGMEDSCVATFKAYRRLKKYCGKKGFKVLRFNYENRKVVFQNVRVSEN